VRLHYCVFLVLYLDFLFILNYPQINFDQRSSSGSNCGRRLVLFRSYRRQAPP